MRPDAAQVPELVGRQHRRARGQVGGEGADHAVEAGEAAGARAAAARLGGGGGQQELLLLLPLLPLLVVSGARRLGKGAVAGRREAARVQ
jgi:hypothetical protein